MNFMGSDLLLPIQEFGIRPSVPLLGPHIGELVERSDHDPQGTSE
jgi:hypothetical protein